MRRFGTTALIVSLGITACTGDTDRDDGRITPARDAGTLGGNASCHDPNAALPMALANACTADARFTDPVAAESAYGASSESFAFFFARRCATDSAPEVRACTVADLRDQAACEVSVGCATCYADFGACVNANCWGECLKPECTGGPSATDPEQWVNERCPDLEDECNACRCGSNPANANCFGALEACAGGELEALTEACGRGGG